MGWTAFPYPDEAYDYSAARLEQAWPRLHAGDAEPWPEKAALREAWIAFHAGRFDQARRRGLDAGVNGYAVAHKASCVYASYLEPDPKRSVALFEEVAERCERQQAERPHEASGFYWHGYALGRYAQSVSVVKALARGLAPRVRASLETAIRLAPAHADAHIALGVFHAEIVKSVGAVIASLTYGASKQAAWRAFDTALELDPGSAIARIEYAKARMALDGKGTLEGKGALAQAQRLFREAAALEPQDAAQRLYVELARRSLEDA